MMTIHYHKKKITLLTITVGAANPIQWNQTYELVWIEEADFSWAEKQQVLATCRCTRLGCNLFVSCAKQNLCLCCDKLKPGLL